MIKELMVVRPTAECGQADFAGLMSAHSFSFGQYHDPNHLHFGVLPVINDDEVAGGDCFSSQHHSDDEIFSYVLEGTLEHKNAMGNRSSVSAGGVECMSAGSGVTQSEFNPTATDRTRFLQVWLIPDERGVKPCDNTMQISSEEKRCTNIYCRLTRATDL